MSRSFILVCGVAAVAALGLGCARSRLRDTGSPSQAGDDHGSNPASSSMAGVGAAGEGASAGSAGQGGAGGEGGTAGINGSTGGSTAPDPNDAGGGNEARPIPPAPIDSRDEVPVPTPSIIADDASELPTGVWVGETSVAFACSTTSRRVTLQITPGDGNEPAQGTIVFGDNDPVPPVEDPEQSYPPGISWEEAQCRSNRPTPGFAYAVRDGGVSSSGRFDFRVAVAEPYIPWCALQTSHRMGDGVAGYLCTPELSSEESFDCYSAEDRSACVVPAGKLAHCAFGGICLCFADGCTTDLNRFNRFDLERTSTTEMAGIVAQAQDTWDQTVELRLRKVQ